MTDNHEAEINQHIVRGWTILMDLADRQAKLATIKEISKSTELPYHTVRRNLLTLEYLGLAERRTQAGELWRVSAKLVVEVPRRVKAAFEEAKVENGIK